MVLSLKNMIHKNFSVCDIHLEKENLLHIIHVVLLEITLFQITEIKIKIYTATCRKTVKAAFQTPLFYDLMIYNACISIKCSEF